MQAGSGAARWRSKTTAARLALLAGVFGAHRFYLRGARDALGWAQLAPTLPGLWGLWRALSFGLDDRGARLALPLLGLSVGAAMFQAVLIGLCADARWDARWNAHSTRRSASGWGAVLVVMVALLAGTAALMGTLAFVLQGLYGGA
jgi:hypothetical protein